MKALKVLSLCVLYVPSLIIGFAYSSIVEGFKSGSHLVTEFQHDLEKEK